jgi:hypothetical protein
MKLKLKNSPEQVELIKALASKDQTVAREAAEAFAAFIGPVVQKVLSQAGTAPMIYVDNEFDEDDNPSIPLDLYYGTDANHVAVWAQNVAGGLPTSEVSGAQEMKIATYRLDSAVSFLKRYARRARLDVVSKALERMAQEVLVKQERNAWAVLLKALAEASTGGSKHVVGSDTASSFNVGDLNKLMTRIKRINTSFAAGTPAGFDSKGLTDLFVSPEIMQDIRGFAYNPVNTVGNKSTGPVALPNNVREDIFRSAGASEIYGVTVHELVELGVSKKYNTLFGEFAAGNSIPNGGGAGTFDSAADEIVVGVDLGREAFIRPVARQSESGGQFIVLPDDQFASRAEKTGFYGFVEEGRVCLDARAAVGIAV